MPETLPGSKEYRAVVDAVRFAVNAFSMVGVVTGSMSVIGAIVLACLTFFTDVVQAWDFAVLLFTGGIILMLWAVYSDDTKSRPLQFVACACMNGYNPSIQHGINLDASGKSFVEARIIQRAYPHVDTPFWWFIPPWLKVWTLTVSIDILVTLVARRYGIWPFDELTRRDFIVDALIVAQAVFIGEAFDSAIQTATATPRRVVALLLCSVLAMGAIMAVGFYIHRALLSIYIPFFAAYMVKTLTAMVMWLASVLLATWLYSLTESDDNASSDNKEVSQ